MLIRDYLGVKSVDGDVGIELEVEAERPLPENRFGCWSPKADGSLRGAYNMEFISKPIKCDDKKRKKIDKLIDEIKPSRPDPNSNRTSLHVHVNVLEHTFTQTFTAMCTYWLIDNIMVEYCGPARSGCMFCLRLKDAENILHSLCRNMEMETYRPFRGVAENVRYSSQNVASINSKGTLEYRSMRGTLDPEIIDMWSTNLYNMVNNSKNWSNPAAMMDFFYSKGHNELLNQLFDEPFVKELKKIPFWEDKINENIGIVCQLAYIHNWEKWENRLDTYYGRNRQDPYVPVQGIRARDDVMVDAVNIFNIDAAQRLRRAGR